MPSKAMTQSSDSQNLATYGADQRPPLTITLEGRRVLVPSLDELTSRKGAKGLQLCLLDLTHHHFMVHGYDWKYLGGEIVAKGSLYFVHFGGVLTQHDVHYLGRYRQALDFLMAYAKTGKPNDANRRAR